MKKMLVTVVPETVAVAKFDEAQIKRALFHAQGMYGHDLFVIPAGFTSIKRRALLCKENRIIMQANIDECSVPESSTTSILVEFLQQAFIRDFWRDAKHRTYQPGEEHPGRSRQNWSDLMRDCNSIGYWLNGGRSIRNLDDDDTEQQYYAPPIQAITMGSELNTDTCCVTSVYFRFLCRRARAVREVGLQELDKNLEHLMVSRGCDADAMNERSYIKQTFTYDRVAGDDVYQFVGTNILKPDANPFVLEFNEHTTFLLGHIRKGKAGIFTRERAGQRRLREWRTTSEFVPFYKFKDQAPE